MGLFFVLQDLGAHIISWNIEPLTHVQEHGILYWPWW
jgi:hypothetical protein